VVRCSVARRSSSAFNSIFKYFLKNKNDSIIASFECHRTPASNCGCCTCCGKTPSVNCRLRRRPKTKSCPPSNFFKKHFNSKIINHKILLRRLIKRRTRLIDSTSGTTSMGAFILPSPRTVSVNVSSFTHKFN